MSDPFEDSFEDLLDDPEPVIEPAPKSPRKKEIPVGVY